MPMTAVDTDVLIVGAGPVGLFLANECARRGLRYRIVEAHAGRIGVSESRLGGARFEVALPVLSRLPKR